MASRPQISSGTEGENGNNVVHDRKKRRMMSNRESARRSRQRKQQHLEDLIREVDQLQRQNGEIAGRANEVAQEYAPILSENIVLIARRAELTARLQHLNYVIDNVERTSPSAGKPAAAANIPFPSSIPERTISEIGDFGTESVDPMLRPLQSACSMRSIVASAGFFQF